MIVHATTCAASKGAFRRAHAVALLRMMMEEFAEVGLAVVLVIVREQQVQVPNGVGVLRDQEELVRFRSGVGPQHLVFSDGGVEIGTAPAEVFPIATNTGPEIVDIEHRQLQPRLVDRWLRVFAPIGTPNTGGGLRSISGFDTHRGIPSTRYVSGQQSSVARMAGSPYLPMTIS